MKSKKSKVDIKKNTKKRNKIIKRVLIILVAILLVIAIVLTSVFFYYRQTGMKSIKPNLAENTEYFEQIEYDGHTYKYNEDVVAFAFVGVDQRNFDNQESADFFGANDTNIVVAINTVSGEVNMIAVPRETVTEIDIYQNGKYQGSQKERLALAYSYGDGKELSYENAMTAISRSLKNIPIEKYFVLDLDGIAAINDSIGGVMLKSKSDFDEENIKAGQVFTLHGKMAERYVRARSMTDVNGSFDRTDRQVQYLQAFFEQTFPAILIDFSTINGLYNVASQYSKTNLTINEVTYLASLLIGKGTNSYNTIVLKGEMQVEDDIAGEGMAHTLFMPDEDYMMKTVLDTFYLRVS